MAHVVRCTAAERGGHGGRRVDQGGRSAGGTEGRQTAGTVVVGFAAHGDRCLRAVELGQVGPGLGAGGRARDRYYRLPLGRVLIYLDLVHLTR